MSKRWSDSTMLKFVDLYRQHECLWNYKLEAYKNRDARENALAVICHKMNIPGLTVAGVKEKIKTLRTMYRREHAMVLKSKKNEKGLNGLRIPKLFWYNQVDKFLDGIVHTGVTRPDLGTARFVALKPKATAPQLFSWNLGDETVDQDKLPNRNEMDLDGLCKILTQAMQTKTAAGGVYLSATIVDTIEAFLHRQDTQNVGYGDDTEPEEVVVDVDATEITGTDLDDPLNSHDSGDIDSCMSEHQEDFNDFESENLQEPKYPLPTSAFDRIGTREESAVLTRHCKRIRLAELHDNSKMLDTCVSAHLQFNSNSSLAGHQNSLFQILKDAIKTKTAGGGIYLPAKIVHTVERLLENFSKT